MNKNQLDKILSFFDHAKNVEKLECLVGGERWGNKGFFVKPTIYINVDDNSKLA